MPIKTPFPQYELEMISLEQLLPQDHQVRKVVNAIDFEFIRDEVAHLYQDMAKLREAKGKKPLKASEKV